MFRQRHRRRPPFSDFINWTDYHWEPSVRQEASPGPGPGQAPWHYPRPRYTFLQVLLAGLAVVVGLKLMFSLRSRRNRPFLQRGVLAVLLLMAISYIFKRSRPL
jgi:hypothetical protein